MTSLFSLTLRKVQQIFAHWLNEWTYISMLNPSRGVFRTLSNIYDRAFLQKQFTAKSH